MQRSARRFGSLAAFASLAALGACSGPAEVVLSPDEGADASVDASADDASRDASGGFDVGTLDGTGCVPPTCADLGVNCGAVTDKKCGGVIQCGSCEGGALCGANGHPNVCGSAGDVDAGPCDPLTCAGVDAKCGSIADGCGHLVDCGPCQAPETCGGGGVPYHCGDPTSVDAATCQPVDCAAQNLFCGPAGDGCGHTLDCGPCAGLDTCGGGGEPGKCGHVVCSPRTCADQLVGCGPAGDGCGATLDCGGCTSPRSCGGDPAKPGQCGCTGACANVPECSGGATTTLTGTVKDPAGNNPLYNVLVYVPNDPSDPELTKVPSGTTCDQCGAAAAGNPLVTTYTKTDGTFSLAGVPVGKGVTLVIQLGRWRRLFQVDVDTACQSNVVKGTGTGGAAIAGGVLTMPKNKAEGNIPLTAIVTGGADALECVFYKMGIDRAEFTNPGGGGRIELYQGAGYDPFYGYSGVGARIDANTPLSPNVVGFLPTYDMVVLSCQGENFDATMDPLLAQYAKLVDYANGGGRLFASHYSYTYLQEGGAANPFYGTATWSATETQYSSLTGYVDVDTTHNPKGPDFAAWLGNVGALGTTNPPSLDIAEPRYNVTSVVAPTQQWLYFLRGGRKVVTPLHFTFNTPVGAPSASQCGRVLFSDFHVVTTGISGSGNQTFPSECSAGAMTAQEKVLEFMLFDLGACVQPYTPVCTPTTCGAANVECGATGDGCGGALDCGNCPAGETCGLGGPGKCGKPSCTATTCAAQGIDCGYAGDGCGNLLTCPPCPAGQTCGGGGQAGKCGAPGDGGATCKPLDCAQQGIECGQAGDGCGHVITCPPCPTGEYCGGGGPGRCGNVTCAPLSCAAQKIECGLAGDGCGDQIDCGNCPTGQICGLAGPGKCGSVH